MVWKSKTLGKRPKSLQTDRNAVRVMCPQESRTGTSLYASKIVLKRSRNVAIKCRISGSNSWLIKSSPFKTVKVLENNVAADVGEVSCPSSSVPPVSASTSVASSPSSSASTCNTSVSISTFFGPLLAGSPADAAPGVGGPPFLADADPGVGGPLFLAGSAEDAAPGVGGPFMLKSSWSVAMSSSVRLCRRCGPLATFALTFEACSRAYLSASGTSTSNKRVFATPSLE
mmetsp:Transcript_126912/g.367338  ORF Transcript_126912/g.367338 Transcript_126912/m.367338 type:complete len:229 (+) Transcript_126912:1219-1905(+)